MSSFPKGARIVHRKLLQRGEVQVGDFNGESLGHLDDYQDNHIVEKASFGIPREPEDFVKKAIKAGHHRFLDYKSIKEIDSLLEQNFDACASALLFSEQGRHG